MKDSVLRPGDRAIVIREHCVDDPLGQIVTIGPRIPPPFAPCRKCGGQVTLPMVNIASGDEEGFWPIAWLRKLPEISEEHDVHEEATA